MKPLIIGEAPGKHGDPTKPVEGRIGARLAACCGLSLTEFLTTFDRVNLLDVQPQDSGKGADFNVKAAGKVARQLEPTLRGRPFVLFLGKRVGAAFKLTHIDYFVKVPIGGVTAYVMPHPSGVSRWWNDLSNELQMIAFMHARMKELDQKAGSGSRQ